MYVAVSSTVRRVKCEAGIASEIVLLLSFQGSSWRLEWEIPWKDTCCKARWVGGLAGLDFSFLIVWPVGCSVTLRVSDPWPGDETLFELCQKYAKRADDRAVLS